MVTQLDKIILPPPPRPTANVAEYQRNVENWTREVEQTFRQFEAVVRALVDAVNKQQS